MIFKFGAEYKHALWAPFRYNKRTVKFSMIIIILIIF